MAGADGTPIQYEVDFKGTQSATAALKSIRESYDKNIASVEKFDKEVIKQAERMTQAYTRRAAQALVKNKLGLDDNTRSANSLRSSLDRLAVETHKQSAATQNQATATRASAVAMRTSAIASRQASAAALQASQAAMQMATRAQRVTPALSAVGTAISRLSPQVGAIATSFGTAGGAIGGVASVLGGGAGLVVGGLIGLAGAAAIAFKHFNDETKDLARASIDLNTTLEAQVKLIEQARTAASKQQQLAMGVAGPDVQFAEVRRLEATLGQNAHERAEARRSGDHAAATRLDAQRRQIEARRDAARAQLQEARRAEAALRGDDAEGEIADARKQFTDERRQAAEKAAADQLKSGGRFNTDLTFQLQQRAASVDAARAFDTLQFGAQPSLDQIHGGRAQALSAAGSKDMGAEFAKSMKDASQFGEMRSEIEELAGVWDNYQSAGIDAFNAVGVVGIGALQGLAKGHEVSFAKAIESVGDMLVASGTRYLLEGGARALFSYGLDPTATGLLTQGSVMVGAGIAMGAAGARAAGGGGGGGGGGPPRSATPIAPSRETGARGDRPLNLTINTLKADADLGVHLKRAWAEADRQGL